jgi:WD40 repeat protein
MDLPKTPEACPHGSALLALGLGGGDGRGVIQLCDAFRGGSATHELIGHTGGVNGLEWDPQHPFRLASAGEDCAVRLWDIRKAGASACLGVLDREKGMHGDDVVPSKLTLVQQPSAKKRRVGAEQYHHINDLSRFQGVESHGVPVSSVAFTPTGDELVSAGVDGKILHWDLRPDSCFLSPEAALRDKLRKGTHHSGMDPAVSMCGRLYPTVFNLRSRSSTEGSLKRPSYRRNKTVLAISQTGSKDTTMLFASTSTAGFDSKISGYSLYNGAEQVLLDGHLGDVTCILPVSNWDNRSVGCCDDTRYDVKLLTGGKDGVVLSWGAPVCKSSGHRNAVAEGGERCKDGCGGGEDVVSILRRQRQQRSRWTNCRVGDTTSNAEGLLAQDVDSW